MMKSTKKRIFIIHGWYGSPSGAWFPWLKRKLEQEGFEVHAPSLPNPEKPRMDAWLGAVKEAVGVPDKDCYFVGHSLGCITILRFVESIGQEISGAVLVAGFTDANIDVDENEDLKEIGSFFPKDVDFSTIKSRCRKFIAIHSDDDPYVPLKYSDIFRKKLGAEIIVKKGMKHFNGTELPEAFDAVMRLATRIG